MLVFEKSRQGRGNGMLPKWEGETFELPKTEQRQKKLHLPEIAEGDLSRHYSELARKSHGVNDGFYPLGSCTMIQGTLSVKRTGNHRISHRKSKNFLP